ncbi:MAG: hypothetical protein LBV58_01870 [Acholeplasmatales bacterium]|jgi:Fic family protein|nr:hypothetical protein [Acholeplasmatales bacterium]
MSYIPSFTITDEILELAIEITEIIERINLLNSLIVLPKLRKINLIKSIQSSLAIENNSMSQSQTQDIINGKLVIGPFNESSLI